MGKFKILYNSIYYTAGILFNIVYQPYKIYFLFSLILRLLYLKISSLLQGIHSTLYYL